MGQMFSYVSFTVLYTASQKTQRSSAMSHSLCSTLRHRRLSEVQLCLIYCALHCVTEDLAQFSYVSFTVLFTASQKTQRSSAMSHSLCSSLRHRRLSVVQLCLIYCALHCVTEDLAQFNGIGVLMMASLDIGIFSFLLYNASFLYIGTY